MAIQRDMADPRLLVPRFSRIPRVASAVGLALAISVGQAGAQAPTITTQLAPAIRNFEWEEPSDRQNHPGPVRSTI